MIADKFIALTFTLITFLVLPDADVTNIEFVLAVVAIYLSWLSLTVYIKEKFERRIRT